MPSARCQVSGVALHESCAAGGKNSESRRFTVTVIASWIAKTSKDWARIVVINLRWLPTNRTKAVLQKLPSAFPVNQGSFPPESWLSSATTERLIEVASEDTVGRRSTLGPIS